MRNTSMTVLIAATASLVLSAARCGGNDDTEQPAGQTQDEAVPPAGTTEDGMESPAGNTVPDATEPMDTGTETQDPATGIEGTGTEGVEAPEGTEGTEGTTP